MRRASSRSTSTGCTSCCGGRFAYDPTLDDARIAALVAQRFPGVDAVKLLKRLAGRFDDLSTGDRLSLGELRLPVVHRGLPQPAGPREHRQRISQRGDLHQPAVHPGTANIPIPQYVAAIARMVGCPRARRRTQVAATSTRAPMRPWSPSHHSSASRRRARTRNSPARLRTSTRWRCWASTTPRKFVAPPSWRCSAQRAHPGIRSRPWMN